MEIYKAKDYQDMSRKAANILSAQVILKPGSVLGLATGSSPLGVYDQLIQWYKKGDLDFSKSVSINLDEYYGLSPDDPQSYSSFMRKHFFDHINIRPENTHIPNGLEQDTVKECRNYDQIISGHGGIDMQLLGLGHNGHIGFNEPGAAFEKDTYLVELSQTTIDANKRFFDCADRVPRYAYTMGIRGIMQAHHILVIVSGKEKAGIVKKAFQGPVTPQVPASVLQLHNHVTLVGDEEALSEMEC